MNVSILLTLVLFMVIVVNPGKLSLGILVQPLSNCSNVMSDCAPTLPTCFQNLDKCRIPESQSIVTILCPGPSWSAVFIAAIPMILLVRYPTSQYILDPVQCVQTYS